MCNSVNLTWGYFIYSHVLSELESWLISVDNALALRILYQTWHIIMFVSINSVTDHLIIHVAMTVVASVVKCFMVLTRLFISFGHLRL